MSQHKTEPIPTRQSLLGRLKDWQDDESWREFFETYWRLIYSVGRKAGLTDAEAHDVVQETLVSLAKTMPKFKYDPEVCAFKTWLQHLARKRIIDVLRKREPAGLADRELENGSVSSAIERVPDAGGLNFGEIWNQEWRQTLFDRALETVKKKVKPRQYQIFYLYVMKQLPVFEVARTMGVNVAQVYLAKHRVASVIKKELRLLEARLI
jgi:RNA polymerase sigma-70 factor (ECF subfamily)